MTKRVTIVDYGVGNLFNLERAFAHLGIYAELVTSGEKVARADRLVIPGVGAFGEGIENLRARGLIEPIKAFIKTGKPVLGICLGMQLLATSSTELGNWKGLDVLHGQVVRFTEGAWKLPLISWCPIRQRDGRSWDRTILEDIPSGSEFYFNHSFHFQAQSPEDTLATTSYAGLEFTSVAHHQNIFACQFHPERSAKSGLALLSNFSAISF
jgi:glutamine amidotransferase